MKLKILIYITILVVASSCGKEVGRCDLSEAQINAIPYKKGQVISFLDSLGNVIDLNVTNYKLAWRKTESPEGGGLHEDHITIRDFSFRLKSELNNIDILFYMAPYACVNDQGDYCSLYIDLMYYRCSFFIGFDIEGNMLTYGTVPFFDSLEIKGKVYYGVMECIHNRGVGVDNTSPPYETMQLFYNKEYGILQIKKDGENYLMLKN